ncbi:hypothetical protein BC939DRAFT_481934 [Gamsiella multidivaricata]|uniref:uncharacterized protein n=1 Tax=Gamsiella multidivaricata TaxID=101098 RepID=UPI00221F186A|nr:uncharacterized protein BC939DRAFT_481934 [Gamsiella multidivaricata]KAG0368086.1 hypothetical protein BGZ54_002702 [Gamsiella multidivaricata]KAI7816548.1 hypothetical protein BC939DRAFT_481934 [Gamsiella multidivaricata]
MQTHQPTKTANTDDNVASTTTTTTTTTTTAAPSNKPATVPGQDSKVSPANDKHGRRRSAIKDVAPHSTNSSPSVAAESNNTISATQVPVADSQLSAATEATKRSNPKKKTGRSKKLVARRGPHRSGGEEAIELAVSSSDEEEDRQHASGGSESDDPDTEEEADLQVKRLALEKLSLERKGDHPPIPNKASSRKQQQQQQHQNRGRAVSQESQPSLQPTTQNRDSAPASPTPTTSHSVPSSSSSKKKRNKKAKQQDQKQNQPAVAGKNTEGSQSQKNGADEVRNRQSIIPSSSPAPSQSHADAEPTALSKPNKRLSKQGISSTKSGTASSAPDKDTLGDESTSTDWGDSPMPEPSAALENSPADKEQQEQIKSTAHLSRPVSRGRGGRAAVEARVEYRRKLAEDPRFVPHLGEFWGHDDRYRGAGLKNFSDRGGFRGRFMGRGGFDRGGMAQGPSRGDARNDRGSAPDKDSQSQDTEDKDSSPVRPRSDRWSHDGYDQLMKVQEKSHRQPRNDSRPRSMNAKPSGPSLSRSTSNNPGLSQNAAGSSATPAPAASTSTNEASKSQSTNVATKTVDTTTPKFDEMKNAAQDKAMTQSQGDSTSQPGPAASALTKSERPRSSIQFGEKDVKRASRLLHSALPKPVSKAPAPEIKSTSTDANGAEMMQPEEGSKGSKDSKDASSIEKAGATTATPAPTSTNPKFRQPMPQSQPAVQHSGFRPHFIPGNFSSRGRGRGGFHPGHFGHRGGHQGGFHGSHHHHPHSPQLSQQPSTTSSATATNTEAPKAGTTSDLPETSNANGSKRYLGHRQEDRDEEQSYSKAAEAPEEQKKVDSDTAASSRETAPISLTKSLKTAINAAPFKPSTLFVPAEQRPTTFEAEEQYYGEDYNQDGYYYDPQQAQLTQPMYYYYYPPVNMPSGSTGAMPVSMPMAVPMPVPMGMPMGMPMGVPMPGQPFMAPMYYDGSIPVSGAMPADVSEAAAAPVPGAGGEMMMMMVAPEDYNNYYYYQPPMYYPSHPPAHHPDPHHPQQHQTHDHQQTSQSTAAQQTRT